MSLFLAVFISSILKSYHMIRGVSNWHSSIFFDSCHFDKKFNIETGVVPNFKTTPPEILLLSIELK